MQFVADVAPFELMKIRILNGGHAAIAYPAGLLDIHWSDEMNRAWETIKNHPRCAVSIDLFRFGVVFTNQKFQNQHYTVRY